MRTFALIVVVLVAAASLGCSSASTRTTPDARAVDEESGRTRAPGPPMLPPREPVPVLQR